MLLTQNDDNAVEDDAKYAVGLVEDVVFTKQLPNEAKPSAIPAQEFKQLVTV